MANFLSVIIPAYNSETTISNAIESVLSQTFDDYELLIVDGLSGDSTIDIVKRYASKDNRIKWISEKDNGVYDAMNKGILMSKGTYLYFLGSDDELYTKETLEQVFIESRQVDFIYGNVLFKQKREIYSGESSLKKLVEDQISICHQAIFYHRRIFDIIGLYDIKYFIHADYDLNLKCFENESISKRYIDLVVACYNELGISSTQSNADGFHTDLTRHYIKYYIDREKLYNENQQLKEELRLIKNSRPYKVGEFMRKLIQVNKKPSKS